MEIKELLAEGTTEEELIAQLQKQISEAKAELEKERAAAEREKKEAEAEHNLYLADRRDELVEAILMYFDALGFFDDEDDMLEETWDKYFNKLSDVVKNFEKNLKSLWKMADILEKSVTDKAEPNKKENSWNPFYDWAMK